MGLKLRRYKLLGDFNKVSYFLSDNYSIDKMNGYLLQPYWEYAHTHPLFNHKLTHRFGLWEENEIVVAIACYEMDLGDCLIFAAEGYEYLYSEMIDYAEKELFKLSNGENTINIYTTEKQTELTSLLSLRGYTLTWKEPITIFSYENKFPEFKLPDGFSIISLEDENDIQKINDCLWKGFDHGDVPDNDLDCRLLMQSGPNFRKDLTTIVKAPNGEYACFAGMWLDEKNNYAYLEPLATVPAFRKLGLGTIALTVAMKKTTCFGAQYCIGGSIEFYSSYGFDTISNREMWTKSWI